LARVKYLWSANFLPASKICLARVILPGASEIANNNSALE
jgi:hypothetical protein